MYDFYIKRNTKDEDNMRVEILIREIREKNNIKLETLAKKSGLTKGALSKMERGEVEPRLSTLVLISLALKCDVSDLYKIHF